MIDDNEIIFQIMDLVEFEEYFLYLGLWFQKCGEGKVKMWGKMES